MAIILPESAPSPGGEFVEAAAKGAPKVLTAPRRQQSRPDPRRPRHEFRKLLPELKRRRVPELALGVRGGAREVHAACGRHPLRVRRRSPAGVLSAERRFHDRQRQHMHRRPLPASRSLRRSLILNLPGGLQRTALKKALARLGKKGQITKDDAPVLDAFVKCWQRT